MHLQIHQWPPHGSTTAKGTDNRGVSIHSTPGSSEIISVHYKNIRRFYGKIPNIWLPVLSPLFLRAFTCSKLPMPGRPTDLDLSRAKVYCACGRCGWGFVWTNFLSSIISSLSPTLWETARYRLKYCLKGSLNSKQPTNQRLPVQHF